VQSTSFKNTCSGDTHTHTHTHTRAHTHTHRYALVAREVMIPALRCIEADEITRRATEDGRRLDDLRLRLRRAEDDLSDHRRRSSSSAYVPCAHHTLAFRHFVTLCRCSSPQCCIALQYHTKSSSQFRFRCIFVGVTLSPLALLSVTCIGAVVFDRFGCHTLTACAPFPFRTSQVRKRWCMAVRCFIPR
jgi:hypothetical protein